jgi:hypothetical protein
MSDLTPETSSSNAAPVGFKEWAFVCEALGQGVQTLILRKGGIHEGKKGFHFEYEDFWLFPTGFHAQGDQLLWLPEDADKVAVPQDEERELVDVKYFAKTQQIWRITDWDKLAALAPFHVWKEEVVRERFAWNEESCLHIALVRVHKLPITWSFPYLKGYGGCRSWVKLPPEGKDFEPIVTPVLADEVWNEIAEKIKAVLG